MKLIFFDFEVFFKNWLVVFIDYDTKEQTIIIDNREKLLEFYNTNKMNMFIGYNNRYYDQHILKAILLGLNPYDISNELIKGDKNGYQLVKDNGQYPINNFDVSTGFHSLKQLEAFMGSKIQESSVDFSINRKLTESEIQEILDYCIHDVEETINVFDNRKEEFNSQLALIETFNLDMSLFNKTKAQLGSYILGAKKVLRDDEFELLFPDTLNMSDKYQYIVNWYNNPENKNYKKSLFTDIAGVPHTLAWGGIHGAIDNFYYEGIILCCDVASLYPSLMIEYDFLSRNVSQPHKFKEIRDKRLELKAKKDPRQLPMKIVINGSYGAMKDPHNELYDPLMANNVCIAGQLLLVDLIEKLEPYCKLIQSNTDGLFLQVEKVEDIDLIKSVAKEWETRTRLDLEWEIYNKIFQKDVNNYIIINEKGKYKSKGAYVKKLSNIDYDLPIVNKALINHFINNKPIEDTVNECNDFREYQKIVKISSKYLHALHGENRIKEKVIRVFASKNENDPGIFKVKNGNKIEKMANTPEKSFIYNDKILGKIIPEYLDKQYYIDVAKKRLSDFIEGKSIKKSNKINSDIKFINEDVKEELLNIATKEYNTFVDLLVDLSNNENVNNRQIEIFTRLNYFKRYGLNKKLILIFEEFTKGKNKYSKTYKEKTKQERLKYLYELEKNTEDIAYPIHEQIKYELDYLGKPIVKYNSLEKHGYILKIEKNYSPKLTLYGLYTGEIFDIKINKSAIKKDILEVGDIIKISKHSIKPKMTKTEDGFKPIPNTKEYWIEKYEKSFLK